MHKAWKELKRKAERQGWKVIHDGGHLQWVPPSGKNKVWSASSPKVPEHAVKRTEKLMRDRGYVG